MTGDLNHENKKFLLLNRYVFPIISCTDFEINCALLGNNIL